MEKRENSLFRHQMEIKRDNKLRTGFWLGTGSSKTRISLELSEGRVIVAAPKTQVLDRNWERENEKWNLNRNLKVVSKENFRKDWNVLPPCDTLIVDEADQMLGVSPAVKYVKKEALPKASQMFESLISYVNKHGPKRIYLATATITRSPMCVFAAGCVLGRWKYNLGNFYRFRDRYYLRLPMPGREVFAPRKDAESRESLAALIRELGYVGRLEDYFDTPEQTYRTIHVETGQEQKKRIGELRFEFPDPVVFFGKRLQVENGILTGDEFTPNESFSNGKIDAILDLALEFPRMIIFAKYTEQIKQIEASLSDYRTFVLDGRTKDRGALLSEVSKSDEYVMICQSQISAGWEMPECPVMVFASMTYSVADRIQAEGRIQRANNIKKNLYITLVTRGGVDEAVASCIAGKKDFNELVYARENA